MKSGNGLHPLPFIFTVALATVSCAHHSGTQPSAPTRALDSAVPSQTAQSYLEYRYFPTPEDALIHVVSTTTPKVIGFGEYHSQHHHHVDSALNRFTRLMLPSLSRITSDIVVEALVSEENCGGTESDMAEEIQEETERPVSTENEVMTLFQEARSRGVFPHYISLSCGDHERVYGQKAIDYMQLLELIGEKLSNTTRDVLHFRAGVRRTSKPLIAVYGGAIHNDAQPSAEWRSVSFGTTISHRVPPKKYVEIDLVVPEIVDDNTFVHESNWYPLYRDKADDQKTLLIKRSDIDYILVFPRTRRNLR